MLRHGDVPGDGKGHGTLLLQVSGIDLEPTELGGLYFDFEVVDVSANLDQTVWSYSSTTPVLVLFGELTKHVEGPFDLDLTQHVGSLELRTCVRLSRLDLATGDVTNNTDMSWSSVLKLQ